MHPLTPTRFTVLPEEKFSELRASVQERLKSAATMAASEYFRSLLDPGISGLLSATLQHIRAHEGTIWLLNSSRDALVPRFSTGSRADEYVGKFRQPLNAGLIGLVFHTEQPLSENGVYQSARHDKTLDLRLGLQTCAMIAVPLIFCGEERGVLSCSQSKPATGDEPDPPGFTDDDLRAVQLTTAAIGRLIEAKLLRLCIGLEGES
jgi:GAF domain-containing protein